MGEYTPHYPVFLSLAGRLAVVVGGDAPALRKIRQLVRCGADVVVVTPFPDETLRQLEADGRITLERRGYMRGDLAGAFIAYSTETDDTAAGVFAEAETLGCLINIAEDPAHSNYLVPSGVRRGQLQIAISTAGAAPAVAKRLRKELRERFGDEWGAYVELLGDIRALAAQSIDDPAKQARIVAASSEADYLERLADGGKIVAADALEVLIAADIEPEPETETEPDPEPEPDIAPSSKE